MKNHLVIIGFVLFLLAGFSTNELFAQSSKDKSESSKKTWDRIEKDYKKQLELNKDSIIIGFREGLKEAQELFKDMKIKDNGDLVIDGETINIVKPMKGLVEGIAKMSESLGESLGDKKAKNLDGLKELDKVLEDLPKMLQQTIDIFGEALSGLAETDTKKSKKRNKKHKSSRSL